MMTSTTQTCFGLKQKAAALTAAAVAGTVFMGLLPASPAQAGPPSWARAWGRDKNKRSDDRRDDRQDRRDDRQDNRQDDRQDNRSEYRDALRDRFNQARQNDANRQKNKNDWRNLTILGGAATVYGLLKHDNTVAFLGAAGALYSANRYESDRKSQSQTDRARAEVFNRGEFTRDGVRYTKRDKWQNGQHYYYFAR